MRCTPRADNTLLLEGWNPHRWASAAHLVAALRSDPPPEVIEIIPAFEQVAIVYEVTRAPCWSPARLSLLRLWAQQIEAEGTSDFATPVPRSVTIPTCYDGEDLSWVAQQTRLSTDEVATLHRSATYTVLAVGFMPGFAYLDGLPAALRLQRRDVPRSRVAPGNVAIGGPYAGVYPFASPGGWHLIGTTSTRLFDPSRGAALRVGDTVRFVPAAIDDT